MTDKGYQHGRRRRSTTALEECGSANGEGVFALAQPRRRACGPTTGPLLSGVAKTKPSSARPIVALLRPQPARQHAGLRGRENVTAMPSRRGHNSLLMRQLMRRHPARGRGRRYFRLTPAGAVLVAEPHRLTRSLHGAFFKRAVKPPDRTPRFNQFGPGLLGPLCSGFHPRDMPNNTF